MDANEDETEEIQYADDLANWRIAGACRIVKKVWTFKGISYGL